MAAITKTPMVESKDEEYLFSPIWPRRRKVRNASIGANKHKAGSAERNTGLDSTGHRNDASAASQQIGKDRRVQIPWGVSNQSPCRYHFFIASKLLMDFYVKVICGVIWQKNRCTTAVRTARHRGCRPSGRWGSCARSMSLRRRTSFANNGSGRRSGKATGLSDRQTQRMPLAVVRCGACIFHSRNWPAR